MICLSRTEIYDINSEKEVTGLIINFVVTRSNRSINYLGITVFDHVTNQVNFLSLLFYFLNFAYVIIFHILLVLMKGVFKNALANYSVRKNFFLQVLNLLLMKVPLKILRQKILRGQKIFKNMCRLQPDVLKLALEFNKNELFIGGTQEKLRRRGLRQFWTN